MSEFIEQSADEIRYFLLSDAIDERQLIILNKTDFVWKGYTCSARILGESHMVALRKSSNLLQEICACTDLATPMNEVIKNCSLVDLEQPFTYACNELNYSFSYKYLSFNNKEEYMEHFNNNIEGDVPILTLSHKFPIHPEYVHHDPITMVEVQYGQDLIIKSVHTYPNENIYVFTQSTIKIVIDKD